MIKTLTTIAGKNRTVYNMDPFSREAEVIVSDAVRRNETVRRRCIIEDGLSFDYVLLEPKAVYPLHHHNELVEVFFVISGEVIVVEIINGHAERIRATDNDMIVVKDGVVHSIHNQGSSYTKLLCIKFKKTDKIEFMELLEKDRVGDGPGNEPIRIIGGVFSVK